MDKRILGKGLEVSAVGLGCMGLSHAYGSPVADEKAIRLIRQAFKIGYTFFDTAEIYGTSDNPHLNEIIVGEALKEFREKVVIATKFGIRFNRESDTVPYPIIPDSSPAMIRKSVDGSLSRLQTDYIDIYFQHRIDPNVLPEEVAAVMSELIKEGKIRHWGVSEANENYIRRAHAICPITAIENRYSMMYREYEILFPVLEELKIGLVAFSPLANGLLTAAYNKNTIFSDKDDYRSKMPQFTQEAFDKNRDLIELITETAKKKDAAPSQISLAWLMAKKPWIVPIPGTRTESRMVENAEASNIKLSEGEIEQLDRALKTIKMSSVFGGIKLS